MTDETDEDGFLSRWSRRKRRAVEADAEDTVAPESAEPEGEADADLTDAEILAKYNLPDPETLLPGDDHAAFLRAPIPLHLQRVALRKLWRSNPVLAVLDGLNDYDTDFTGDTVAKGTLKTAYKVGRGFLKDLPETGEEPVSVAETEATAVPETSLGPEEAGEDDASGETEETPASATGQGADAVSDALDPDMDTQGDDVPATATRRRMAFRFSDKDDDRSR